MELPLHSLNTLFEQLGLASGDEDIDAFVAAHAPLPGQVKLHQADFWTPSQSLLLQELKETDADWAEYVDQLDVRLR